MRNYFRNLRKKYLADGKASTYFRYALGETLLVVVGILIAFQVNNWKEHRKDRQEEQKILHILQSEFLYNKTELQRNIAKSTLRNHETDSLIRLFGQPDHMVEKTKYKKYIGNLSAYSTFDPSNGALSDLLSSGRLKLLQNDTLRLRLSRWFGEIEDVKEDEIRLIHFGDSQLNPWRLSSMRYNPQSSFPDQSLKLMHNQTFENIVVYMRHQTEYILENYRNLDNEIDSILELISREITD